jgi:hypothetical protein
MWLKVAMVEETVFERRYVRDQAGPKQRVRVVTQSEDVALDPPASVHPTVRSVQAKHDAPLLWAAAHHACRDAG